MGGRRAVTWFFIALLLVSCALAACHGGGQDHLTPQPLGTSKAARRALDQIAGSGTNPTVCEVLASPDPAGKAPAHYRCYLEPNSTIKISGLTLMPNNSSYWCTAETFAGPHSGGASGPAGLAFTASGTPGQQACNRVDSATATISTDSTLPNDFDEASYQVQGSFQLCQVNYVNCGTSQTQAWAYFDFMTGLHINDAVFGRHIENTSVTHVAGQRFDMSAQAPSGGPPMTLGAQGCTWTMPTYYPNDAVSAYNVSNTLASPVQSTPVPANTTNDIIWYNTAAETPTQTSVSCDVHTGGPTDVTLAAVGNLAFKVPATTPTISYGTISVNSQYHNGSCQVIGTYLAYGDPCTVPGIKWQYSTTTDADEANGHIAVWQLIHSLNNSGTDENGTVSTDTLNPADCSDGSLPYKGTSSGPVVRKVLGRISTRPRGNLFPRQTILQMPARVSLLTITSCISRQMRQMPAPIRVRSGYL